MQTFLPHPHWQDSAACLDDHLLPKTDWQGNPRSGTEEPAGMDPGVE